MNPEKWPIMLSTAGNDPITVSGVTGTVPSDGQHNPPVENPATQWHQTYLNPIAPPVPPHLRRRAWPAWVIGLIGLVSTSLVVGLGLLFAARSDTDPPASTTKLTLSSAAAGCQEKVLPQLKAPGTAKFGGEEYSTTNTTVPVRVSGWVDAENSFGALVRNRYSCLATPTDHGWSISDVTFSAW